MSVTSGLEPDPELIRPTPSAARPGAQRLGAQWLGAMRLGAQRLGATRLGATRIVAHAGERLTAIRLPHGALAAVLYLVAGAGFRYQALMHLNTVCACDGGVDATQFIWALGWWPYALLHGLNPVVTHVIYAPGGMNLASGTSVPGAALVAAPVTLLVGPMVAFNLLSLFAPALGAWFAYRLCLYITRSPAASIIGGYLFGFSSYGLGALLGHLHTAFTFAAPAAVLLTLRRLDERLSPRRYVMLLTAVLVAQLLLGTEMAFTLVSVGAVALVCAWFTSAPERRGRIVRLIPSALLAVGLTALVCAPYLYYELLRGNQYSAGWGATYFADALNFLVPTRITWLGGHALAGISDAFSGHDLTESTAYLGPLQIGLVAAFLVGRWRTRTAKFLFSVLLVVTVWSLGGYLSVGGHQLLRLPWSVYSHLPFFDQLLPVRLTEYVALVCAVGVACWIAGSGRATRWRILAGMGAAALILPASAAVYPGTTQTVYHSRFPEPRFFATGLYRGYLHRDEVVLPIPAGEAGYSLLWQARTGMYFRLASGYFGAPPAPYADQPVFWQLKQTAGELGPRAGHALRAFVARQRVGAIVLDPRAAKLWEPVLAADGLRPLAVGGILLYRIPRSWVAAPGGAPS
jgi:hypothetical protein